MYRILRYLKGTPSKSILFHKHDHFQVEVYTNVDWAERTIDRRSTSDYCSSVGGNLVTCVRDSGLGVPINISLLYLYCLRK